MADLSDGLAPMHRGKDGFAGAGLGLERRGGRQALAKQPISQYTTPSHRRYLRGE